MAEINAQNSENMITLVNGNLHMTIDDLESMKTPPSQRFTFESLSAGKLNATNGDIRFRMDGPRDITVEKLSFDWCGGTIYGANLHINPDTDEYSASLFCQQLQFAEILNLFNSVSAKGNGTLNGRLPVILSKGKIRIEKGLLISAPGETGTVSIEGAGLLAGSTGKNTSSSAYIEFAAESLKNFRYEWARLDINSADDDETLTINLKLNGRPASPLPFTYDSNGVIIRNRPGEKTNQGIIHPLRLDINFSIPVNKLFHYGMKWHKLNAQ
jgi:hypothetical protein